MIIIKDIGPVDKIRVVKFLNPDEDDVFIDMSEWRVQGAYEEGNYPLINSDWTTIKSFPTKDEAIKYKEYLEKEIEESNE